jgi:excisionase family DNA binding protein
MRHECKTSDSQLDPDRLISTNELASLLGVDKRTVFRWVRREKLPSPIRALSARRLCWRRATILAFLTKLEATAHKQVVRSRARHQPAAEGADVG